MHTDQPAIFVTVGDVMQFIDKPIHTLKFIVTYEVKSEMMTAKMRLNAGEVSIDYKTIYDSESQSISRKSESK